MWRGAAGKGSFFGKKYRLGEREELNSQRINTPTIYNVNTPKMQSQSTLYNGFTI